MDEIYKLTLIFFLLILVSFVLKKWINQYEKSINEKVKAKDLRTYSEFVYFICKKFYYGVLFLIVVLFFKIIISFFHYE